MSMFAPQASQSWKFEEPGDTHKGTLTEIGEKHQCRDFNTGEPEFWPKSNDPKMQAKLTFDTDERDPSDPQDDGKRTLFVVENGKQGSMLAAIRDAVKAAGGKDLRVGGVLTLTFAGHDPNSANPRNPRKLYRAVWEEPAGGGGMFQQQAPQAPQAPQQQWQPQTPAPQQPQQAPAPQGGAWAQATGHQVGQQPPAPQQTAPQAPAPQQQAQQFQAPAPQQQVDEQTSTFIRSMIGQNVDTQTIVNSIAQPGVTAELVDSYRQQ